MLGCGNAEASARTRAACGWLGVPSHIRPLFAVGVSGDEGRKTDQKTDGPVGNGCRPAGHNGTGRALIRSARLYSINIRLLSAPLRKELLTLRRRRFTQSFACVRHKDLGNILASLSILSVSDSAAVELKLKIAHADFPFSIQNCQILRNGTYRQWP